MTTITLLAAVARNGVIGDGTTMPWHLPEDLRHFKETTMGHAIVMGRRTFESIGRALPGRHTVVITRNAAWHHAGVEVAHSLGEALTLAGSSEEVFVVGGGEVYREAMPMAHRLNITEVDLEPEGSVTFPAIDGAVWREISRRPGESAEGPGVEFVLFERR